MMTGQVPPSESSARRATHGGQPDTWCLATDTHLRSVVTKRNLTIFGSSFYIKLQSTGNPCARQTG